MVVCVNSLGLHGIDGYGVRVECDLSGGLPAFDLVGLPTPPSRKPRTGSAPPSATQALNSPSPGSPSTSPPPAGKRRAPSTTCPSYWGC